MKLLVRAFCILALSTVSLLAADITGTWKGKAETQNGTIERTFVFKVDGSKLTGETTSEMMGKSTLENGKVDGDSVSFTINVKFQDNEMKLNYSGKVKGDAIDFTVDGANGMKIEYKLKKVS